MPGRKDGYTPEEPERDTPTETECGAQEKPECAKQESGADTPQDPAGVQSPISRPRGERFSHFWEYRKWQVLVAVVLIVAITVCAVQCSRRDSYDIYVMYAGSWDVSHTSDGTDVSEYRTLVSALSRVADENGRGNVSLRTLFLLTAAETAALEEQLREEEAAGEDAREINYTLLSENRKVFSSEIVFGDYYICLLSDTLYRENRTRDGVSLFVPLAGYVGEAEVEYCDEGAVYLSSTAFGKLPGMAKMPPNTVVCLRIQSEVASVFGRGAAREKYARAEDAIRRLFAYGT